VPYLPPAQLGEQAPGQQQTDHHPRRQQASTGLDRAGGGQRRIDLSNGMIWVSSPSWPGANTPEATLLVEVMVATAGEGAE